MRKNAKLCAFLTFVFIIAVNSASFAQSVIAGWDTSTLPGGASNFGPSPFASTTTDPKTTNTGFIRGNGVITTGTGAARAWGGTDWKTASASAAVAAGDFFSFTITPKTGVSISYSSLSPFSYRRSGTGATAGVLQYAVGSNAFADVTTLSYPVSASTGGSIAAISLASISALQNVADAVTFRVVNYGASDTAGTWYVFDVGNSTGVDFAINGTTTPELGSVSLFGTTLAAITFRRRRGSNV